MNHFAEVMEIASLPSADRKIRLLMCFRVEKRVVTQRAAEKTQRTAKIDKKKEVSSKHLNPADRQALNP